LAAAASTDFTTILQAALDRWLDPSRAIGDGDE
jgi:hypothetical protein